MIKRNFIPGSGWLYYKLYTQPMLADDILSEQICAAVEYLYESRVIKKFFFIRYSDPSFHLRLRFMTSDPEFLMRFLTPIFNDLLSSKKIYKLTIDTYNREMERYGASSIETAETIFSIDSLYCLRALGYFKQHALLCSHERWLFSLPLVDDILYAMHLNYQSRYQIMKCLSVAYKKEHFFLSHESVKQIDEIYRDKKTNISQYLNHNVEAGMAIFLNQRKQRMVDILDSIVIAQDVSMDFIAGIIHMSTNRWFKTQGRQYELFIYSFLEKYYKTMLFI